MAEPRPSPETICAHAREQSPPAGEPLVAPLFQASVGRLADLDAADARFEGRAPGFLYTRLGNPTVAQLEATLARLEGGEAACVTASGMGAIATTLLALLAPGETLVASPYLYGATESFLRQDLVRWGVRVESADGHDAAAIAAALARFRPAVCYVETIANPLLQVADLPALAERCRAAGARLVVDHTFATPCLAQPLALGADLVIHSLTKFINGHGDAIVGAVIGDGETIARIRGLLQRLGATADPFAAWLTLRGLATLPLRIERACANALALARWLAGQPCVRRVHYPGLPSHPDHALAVRLLGCGGPMLAFELADRAAANRFIEGLRWVKFAPSLGDVATTVSHPASTSHRGLAPAQQRARGIHGGLVRVSLGVERADDLIADFERALAALVPAGAGEEGS